MGWRWNSFSKGERSHECERGTQECVRHGCRWLVVVMLFLSVAFGAEMDVAIVVRPDVPVDNLTFAELRRVMLGDRQYWTSNVRVTLLVRAPGARERDVVLKTIYQMSEAQFRQYWIAKVFRAEAANGPRIVYSNEMATDLANAIPGAVAFVEAPQVPKGMKVLRINGLLPGEKGYPLR
jgi:ABC-type phosphate transport system substrate-binding protein